MATVKRGNGADSAATAAAAAAVVVVLVVVGGAGADEGWPCAPPDCALLQGGKKG